MIKKLTKYGNSFVLILDKPILEILNIDSKTLLKIKTDGKKIIIEPLNTTDTNEQLKKLYKKNAKKYKEDLKKLAD